MGRPEMALEAVQTALQSDPHSATLLAELSRIRVDLKQWQEGYDAARAAYESKPNDIDIARALARAAAKTGQYHEALEVSSLALSSDPMNLAGLAMRFSVLYEWADDTDPNREHLDQARVRAEAWDILAKLKRDDPDDPANWVREAGFFTAIAPDRERSEHAVRQALTHSPDDEDLLRVLAFHKLVLR
jgi:tetratricopeptide (TPR) repeat protein